MGGRTNASSPFGITETNVRPLLVGSASLNLENIKRACVRFVRNDLRVDNCMSYFIFCIENCRDQHFRETLIYFFLNNIEVIQNRPEFRSLTSEQINYLVPASCSQKNDGRSSSWDDMVYSETLSKLLFSLFKWWEGDRDGRLEDFTAISSKFALTRVDPDVLRKIYDGDDTLRLDPTCRNLYLETIERMYFAGLSKSKQRRASVAPFSSPMNLIQMRESVRSGGNANSPFGITEANVHPLLVGATVLNMNDCKQACVSFIREHLTVRNWMLHIIFSFEKCRDRDLQEAVTNFYLNNIQEIQNQAEFRKLKFRQINYLVPLPPLTSQNGEGSGSDELVESDPVMSKLLFSFFKWWEVDKSGRLKDFTTISSKFALTRVDADVLRKIYRGDDTLRLDPTCKSLYLETIENKYFAGLTKSQHVKASVAACSPVQVRIEENTCAIASEPNQGEDREDHSISSSVTLGLENMEIDEGSRRGARDSDNVPYVSDSSQIQEQQLQGQSKCSTTEVGGRNPEESAKFAISEDNSTLGTNPTKEQSFSDNSDGRSDDRIKEIRNCDGIEQTRTGVDTRQQVEVPPSSTVEQPHEDPSVCSEVKLSVQKPGGSRGHKRPAQDDDVELLEVVPVKRNVIAEVDLTIADTDADVTSSTGSAGSPKCTLYFVSGSEHKVLMELDMTDFSAKKVVGYPFEGNSVRLLYNAGKIYTVCSQIINPKGKEERTRSVRSLDLKKKVWVRTPNLNMPRRNFAWEVVDNCIYVMGGVENSFGTDSVEKLSFPFGEWEICGGVPRSLRIYHAVCSSRGHIYVVGGCSLWEKDYVAQCWGTSTDVEVYEPNRRSYGAWHSELPESRIGHCVAAVDDSLYVIGGRLTLSPGPSLTKCMVYSWTKPRWKDIAPLTQARQNFSAFVINRHIYVVGGNEGPPTMEKYDVNRDTWTLVEDCDLPRTGIYSSVAFALR